MAAEMTIDEVRMKTKEEVTNDERNDDCGNLQSSIVNRHFIGGLFNRQSSIVNRHFMCGLFNSQSSIVNRQYL